jgi:hypothetical protein
VTGSTFIDDAIPKYPYYSAALEACHKLGLQPQAQIYNDQDQFERSIYSAVSGAINEQYKRRNVEDEVKRAYDATFAMYIEAANHASELLVDIYERYKRNYKKNKGKLDSLIHAPHPDKYENTMRSRQSDLSQIGAAPLPLSDYVKDSWDNSFSDVISIVASLTKALNEMGKYVVDSLKEISERWRSRLAWMRLLGLPSLGVILGAGGTWLYQNWEIFLQFVDAFCRLSGLC